MTRGRLIVVEGLDRSGKSTQCERLVRALGDACELIKFPDRTTVIGGMIDAYLKSSQDLDDHVIHLLFSANRWEVSAQILRILETRHVVLDRYIYSGIVYSQVKGLDEAWCRAPDVGLPQPDLVLFLDLDDAAAAQRGGYGEERYERRDVQTRVRTAFLALFSGDRAVVRIDAGRDVETVARDIWTEVEQCLAKQVDDKIGTIEA